jgi:hypothetical protein
MCVGYCREYVDGYKASFCAGEMMETVMDKLQETSAVAEACGALIQTLVHQLTFSGVLTTAEAQTVFDLAEKRARQKDGMEAVAEAIVMLGSQMNWDKLFEREVRGR